VGGAKHSWKHPICNTVPQSTTVDVSEARKSGAGVVDALGRRRRLWFRCEQLLGRLASRQQVADFDVGVALGAAAARADQIPSRSAVRKLADRLIREAIVTNTPREDVATAAVMAVWAAIRGRTATGPSRGRS